MQKNYASRNLKLKKRTATQWKRLEKSKHSYTLLNLTAPSGAFAVGGNMGINDLNDLERGEYDCLAGYPALEGQSEAYQIGYGEQYAKERTVGGQQ